MVSYTFCMQLSAFPTSSYVINVPTVSQARPFRFAASICGTRSDQYWKRSVLWTGKGLACETWMHSAGTCGKYLWSRKNIETNSFAWTLCIIIISAVGIMIYISFGGANYLLFPWANTTISSIIPWLGFPCTSIYIIAPELVDTRYHDRSQSWRPRRSYCCWPLLLRACRGVQLETRPVTLSTKRPDPARYEHIDSAKYWCACLTVNLHCMQTNQVCTYKYAAEQQHFGGDRQQTIGVGAIVEVSCNSGKLFCFSSFYAC